MRFKIYIYLSVLFFLTSCSSDSNWHFKNAQIKIKKSLVEDFESIQIDKNGIFCLSKNLILPPGEFSIQFFVEIESNEYAVTLSKDIPFGKTSDHSLFKFDEINHIYSFSENKDYFPNAKLYNRTKHQFQKFVSDSLDYKLNVDSTFHSDKLLSDSFEFDSLKITIENYLVENKPKITGTIYFNLPTFCAKYFVRNQESGFKRHFFQNLTTGQREKNEYVVLNKDILFDLKLKKLISEDDTVIISPYNSKDYFKLPLSHQSLEIINRN